MTHVRYCLLWFDRANRGRVKKMDKLIKKSNKMYKFLKL